MTAPVVHSFPVKRPNYITECTWVGGDDVLKLQIKFPDQAGITRVLSFDTRNTTRPGEVCLPSGLLGNDLNNLGPRARDILVAHTRMACMISGIAIPGSKEFLDAFVQNDTNNLQTAMGTVKVTDVNPTDDQSVAITFKCGTGPNYVASIGHGEINDYSFEPETQLLIVPGAIKKLFSTYVHDYPTTVLTAARKDEIVAAVLALEPWI